MSRKILTISCLSISAIIFFGRPAAAEVPIEGDRNLIKTVLATLRKNATGYERGALSADVVARIGKEETKTTVESVWDETGTYWKHTSVTKRDDSTKGSTTHAEVIGTPKQWMFLTPETNLEANLLQLTPPKVFSLGPGLEILPADLWFSIDRRFHAVDFLDPQYKPQLWSKYVIKPGPNDTIVIDRYYVDGDYCTVVVSLKQGGNIVSYEMHLKKAEGVWMRGRFQWVKGQDKVWYVKKLRMERSVNGSADTIDTMIDVTYKQFDTNPAINPNRFTAASLDLAEGTVIEEYDARGNPLKVAKLPSKRNIQQELDRLTEKLKKGSLSGK